jgi:hypothetical protein
MDTSRCAGCGLLVAGGTEGCREIFTAVGVRAWEDTRVARLHWIVVDAYALQHPDAYCRSAKSLAAHLTGMSAGLEHAGDPKVRATVQRWLNGTSPVTKPELPDFRGTLTIGDVQAAADPADYERIVDAWTRDVWAAYAPLHALAREWIAAALT